jgi:hypothetical protein
VRHRYCNCPRFNGEYNFCPPGRNGVDINVENSVIGMIIIACIALLGILLFCFEFVYERNKRRGPKP